MIGQPRLDHYAAAVPERRGDLAGFGVVFDLFAVFGLGDVRDEEALFLHPLDDQLARAVDTVTLEAVQADELVGHQPIGGLADVGFGIEHVEHFARRKTGAFAHFEVVEIMARRDLDAARTQFGIGVFIGDHRDAAARDRQDHMLADNAGIAFVRRVHRHSHIGQHGFGAGGGDFEIIAAIRQGRTVGERIAQVPETARNRLRFDFEIGNRGLELGIPVHQPLVAVDQPVVI